MCFDPFQGGPGTSPIGPSQSRGWLSMDHYMACLASLSLVLESLRAPLSSVPGITQVFAFHPRDNLKYKKEETK